MNDFFPMLMQAEEAITQKYLMLEHHVKATGIGILKRRGQLIGNFSTPGDFDSAGMLIYRHGGRLIICLI